MKFRVYGPYTVGRENKVITEETSNNYFSCVEASGEDWRIACGCYILATATSGGGWTPWYVGMTETKQLHKASLKDRNIKKFNTTLIKIASAKAKVFLLPKMTPSGGFSKNKEGIAELEKMLIGLAFQYNPDLLNTSETKYWKKTELEGVMNPSPGRATDNAVRLRETLGLQKPFGKPLD